MEMAKSEIAGERVRIFPIAWERAVLLLGLVPLVFAMWDPGWFQERWKMQIIADLLFLNVIHNMFTIYVMWRSDEMRQAIREHAQGQPWRLHLRAAAVFAISMALYFVFQKRLVDNRLFVIGAITVFEFLAMQHVRSQVMGLSLLYDHRLQQLYQLNEKQTAKATSGTSARRRVERSWSSAQSACLRRTFLVRAGTNRISGFLDCAGLGKSSRRSSTPRTSPFNG